MSIKNRIEKLEKKLISKVSKEDEFFFESFKDIENPKSDQIQQLLVRTLKYTKLEELIGSSFEPDKQERAGEG